MRKAKPLAVLLLLLLSLMLLYPSSAGISDEELEAAIYSLRSRGYRLFGNAITSSDVRLDLLFSNASFTLFAPTDASLFSVDMVFPASAYVDVLRHHVALGRHSLPALRSLLPGTAISTLLSSVEIVVSHRDTLDIITVDGVDVALPGLFYGQNLAVHGLAGILTQRTVQESEPPSSPNLQSHDSRYPLADSPAPVSGFGYPAKPPRISTAPSGSPEVSPSPKRSKSIFCSPAIAEEISDSLPTAAPASFSWDYWTNRNPEDLWCSPASDAAGEPGKHRGNNHRSHLLFGEDDDNH